MRADIGSVLPETEHFRASAVFCRGKRNDPVRAEQSQDDCVALFKRQLFADAVDPRSPAAAETAKTDGIRLGIGQVFRTCFQGGKLFRIDKHLKNGILYTAAAGSLTISSVGKRLFRSRYRVRKIEPKLPGYEVLRLSVYHMAISEYSGR